MPGTSARPRLVSLVIALNAFAAVATALFWLVWVVVPEAVQNRPDDQCYLVFQHSFPLADAWFALAAALGAIGLWQRKDWGFLFTLLAGSAGIFLGLMDLLYDLNHGIYSTVTSPMLIEVAIVLLLLTLSPLMIILVWRNRRLFLPGEA